MTESTANSIIRLYLQNSSTNFLTSDDQHLDIMDFNDVNYPLNLSTEESSSTLNFQNDQLENDYDKIEYLPTAYDSLNSNSGSMLREYYQIISDQGIKTHEQTSEIKNLNCNYTKDTGVSNNSSFFMIHFKRLFGHDSAGPVKKKKSFTSNEDLNEISYTTLNVITDSPPESYLEEQRFLSFVEDPEELKESMDSIYENYFRNIIENQESAKEQDVDKSQSIGLNGKFPKVFGNPQKFIEYPFKKQNNTFSNDTLENNEPNKDNFIYSFGCTPGVITETDNENSRKSTLRRFGARTKNFLIHVSKHYDNISFRGESGSSSIWNHADNYTSYLETESIIKKELEKPEEIKILHNWIKRGIKRGNSLSLRRSTWSNNKALNTTRISSETRSVLDLFESPEYKQRIKDSQIRSRKIYEKENEGESIVDENYQIDYKYRSPHSRNEYFKNAFSFKKLPN